MNELTHELLQKAQRIAAEKYPPNSHAYNYEIYVQFTELIVQECVAQCWTVSESESRGSVVSECSKQIRKHFGVEE